ncbi:MAG TPA: molecular chaperone DnaK, partial [Pirellulaceae bacterium]|nr:molecular chaperone DnaK [Pirellulaceae bacterium]
AISRHLSSFLVAHRFAGLERRPGDSASSSPTNSSNGPDPARPDVLLFNGGVFESSEIRARLIAILEKWFRTPAEPNWTPQVLANDRLDLAVARGAAYYGMVRRGEGVKITANLARSYYLGFDSGPSPPPASGAPETSSAARPAPLTTAAAVCVLPGSAEPGQDYPLTERRFELLVSQPVEFPLYVSSTRLDDRAGELVSFDSDQMRALPPIRTALKTRRRADADTAPVQLHARLTEIGTVDLWCAEIDGPRTWRLQFDVRSATQTDLVAHESQAEREGVLDEGAWSSCRAVLDDVFGPEGKAAPDGVVKRLIEAVGLPRDQWPTSLLRRIGETLLELDAGRRRSPVHEARWLNLLGYTLRPGYGLAVDDWRVAETWKLVQGRLGHGAPTSRTESLILWRRIAGGLSAGQQRAVAEPLLAPVRALHRRMTTGKDRGSDQNFSPHESTEVWRLLGSLELLPVSLKNELGRMVLDLLPRRKLDAIRPALAWALGRVGARQGVYGPLNAVVSPDTACQWLERLLETDDGDANCLWAATLLARRTGDRYRDVPDEWRERVLGWLDRHGAKPHYVQLVAEVAGLDADDQARVFGESLPRGLRLV